MSRGWLVVAGAIEALQEQRRSTGRPALWELDTLRSIVFRVMPGQYGPISADPLPTVHDAGMARLLLNIEEAADVLGVSDSTVKRLIRTGELPAVKVGGATRIRCTDVGGFVTRLAPMVNEMEVR